MAEMRASGALKCLCLSFLSIAHEVSQTYFERGRDAGKGVNRNGFFHAFHLPDVFWVEVCQFAEPLLGHFRLLAVLANGLGE